jgi:hypothetical protein
MPWLGPGIIEVFACGDIREHFSLMRYERRELDDDVLTMRS